MLAENPVDLASSASTPMAQSENEEKKPVSAEAPEQRDLFIRTHRRKLPDERRSLTHKFSVGGHEGYITLIRHLKKRAYEVHFFFLWIPTVRRRFDRSIRNFLQHYRALGDSWMLFDNSGTPPILIAFEEGGKSRKINRELYENLTAHWGKQ